jgi:hypothetical protein
VYQAREDVFPHGASTKQVIATAIQELLDQGITTGEQIAQELVTSTFPMVEDRAERFNAILKAGSVVGSNTTFKLHNSYEDLLGSALRSGTAESEQVALAEARGFMEAMTIMYNPIQVEDPTNSHYVDWGQVDRLTDMAIHQHEENHSRV